MQLVNSTNNVMIVTYEDRLASMDGVRLLALSLARHSPELKLTVFSPLTRGECLPDWHSNVDWRLCEDLKGQGWNVKPTVLLRGLETADRVMWIDTDIIVAGPIDAVFVHNPDTIVVGQEFRDSGENGSRIRVENWGWQLRRSLPFHLNSGTVLVSNRHQDLLKTWESSLRSSVYQAAQQIQPSADRPVHLLGDQDVLWALLCSQYSEVEVAFLRNGVDVVQDCGANGFHVVDRLRNIFSSRIMFVHALGAVKPWHFGEIAARNINRKQLITYELSAYYNAASSYAAEVGNPAWLTRRTGIARAMNLVEWRSLGVPGLPIALVSLVMAPALRRKFRSRVAELSARGARPGKGEARRAE